MFRETTILRLRVKTCPGDATSTRPDYPDFLASAPVAEGEGMHCWWIGWLPQEQSGGAVWALAISPRGRQPMPGVAGQGSQRLKTPKLKTTITTACTWGAMLSRMPNQISHKAFLWRPNRVTTAGHSLASHPTSSAGSPSSIFLHVSL